MSKYILIFTQLSDVWLHQLPLLSSLAQLESSRLVGNLSIVFSLMGTETSSLRPQFVLSETSSLRPQLVLLEISSLQPQLVLLVLKEVFQEQQVEHEKVTKFLKKTCARMCPPSSKSCCLPFEWLHGVLGHCCPHPKDLDPTLDACQVSSLSGFFRPHGVAHRGSFRVLLPSEPLSRHWMVLSPILSASQDLVMYFSQHSYQLV